MRPCTCLLISGLLAASFAQAAHAQQNLLFSNLPANNTVFFQPSTAQSITVRGTIKYDAVAGSPNVARVEPSFSFEGDSVFANANSTALISSFTNVSPGQSRDVDLFTINIDQLQTSQFVLNLSLLGFDASDNTVASGSTRLTFSPGAVPGPESLPLFAAGASGVAFLARRRKFAA